MIFAKTLFPLCLLACVSLNSFSQKLPDVQSGSVVIASPLKVDGKLTEGDAFKAFNKNTRLFYSVLNDSKSLFFVIKCEDAQIINKIFMGGITLYLNTSGKKKEKDAYSLTYPIITRTARGQGQRNQGGFGQRASGQAGMSQAAKDSAATEMRKQQIATFKEIKISGFKNVNDSLVSIYNEYGIKAAINIDAKGSVVFECAVPLQMLEINLNKGPEISYNIKLNGRQRGNGGQARAGGNFGGGNFGSGNGNGGGNGRGNSGGGQAAGIDPSTFEPTDFWGKYTPASQ